MCASHALTTFGVAQGQISEGGSERVNGSSQTLTRFHLGAQGDVSRTRVGTLGLLAYI